MDQILLQQAQDWVRDELWRATQFWLDYGIDKKNGGVYTCLDRTGACYSTDKSVWMQGRCGWIFAYLCRIYGVKEEWLAASKSCLDFMEQFCINRRVGSGRMFFTVTEDGQPLRQGRYCYSEAFYAMANAEYYGITGNQECLERARCAYDLYWDLHHGKEDPTRLKAKTYPETRAGRSFGVPMIFLNVTSILRRVDPDRRALYDQRAQSCVDEIFRYHVKPELNCTLENVALDGSPRLYYTEGRTVNPGHDIECVWFLLEQAHYQHDAELVEKAAQIFDWAYAAGWDAEYGGLLYFTDCLKKPQEAYEHDMKLWWPHAELLISSIRLYQDTFREKYLDIFYQTLDYCKSHFSDPAYGEWYGYLRRDGLPTMPSTKGSTFKGPFHMQRSMIQVDLTLSALLHEDS